jgi:hypothetical protein
LVKKTAHPSITIIGGAQKALRLWCGGPSSQTEKKTLSDLRKISIKGTFGRTGHGCHHNIKHFFRGVGYQVVDTLSDLRKISAVRFFLKRQLTYSFLKLGQFWLNLKLFKEEFQ